MARWIEFQGPFDYGIEHREGQQYTTQSPCHDDLIAKAVSGVKSGRKLNN